jgi:hypothetical protein
MKIFKKRHKGDFLHRSQPCPDAVFAFQKKAGFKARFAYGVCTQVMPCPLHGNLSLASNIIRRWLHTSHLNIIRRSPLQFVRPYTCSRVFFLLTRQTRHRRQDVDQLIGLRVIRSSAVAAVRLLKAFQGALTALSVRAKPGRSIEGSLYLYGVHRCRSL